MSRVVYTGWDLDLPPPTESTFERRRDWRVETCLSGLIVVPRTNLSIECLIKNISKDGAKLCFWSGDSIPSKFYLIAGLRSAALEVEVVWSKASELGVRVLDELGYEGLKGSEHGFLRSLMAERTGR